jgi:hypothetical protein
MYTLMVWINVYLSSRNSELFFGARGPVGCPRRRSLADLVPSFDPGSSLLPNRGSSAAQYLAGVTLAFGREIFPETADFAPELVQSRSKLMRFSEIARDRRSVALSEGAFENDYFSHSSVE